MAEPKSDTYGAFDDTAIKIRDQLPPLWAGLRITHAPGEYLDWWADEYDHVRGRTEGDYALRIRLFNALSNRRDWGAKRGVADWLGGLLNAGPLLEEAYRGHWAWFPGVSAPGNSGTYAVGVDTYISSPFVWDCWLWKTEAGDKWGKLTQDQWLDIMRPRKTVVVIRRPQNPFKLVQTAHDYGVGPWVQCPLTDGDYSQVDGEDQFEVTAEGYIKVTQYGLGVEATYTSKELDLGSDWEDWRWFPDYNVPMRRYNDNRFEVWQRFRESPQDDWEPWRKLRLGAFYSNYQDQPPRYHQFKVVCFVNRIDDIAIAALGMKALLPGELSVAYPVLGAGLGVVGGAPSSPVEA